MGMTNTERVTLHRQRKRVGLRPVTVIVSEQEIDFLLAHDYELSRKDADSIGRAVAQFLSDSTLFTRWNLAGRMPSILSRPWGSPARANAGGWQGPPEQSSAAQRRPVRGSVPQQHCDLGFADGIVEDIITALSRARWLFVIARNSSFTYKGKVVDTKQVGRELGVRYVLEGSVRNWVFAIPRSASSGSRACDARRNDHDRRQVR
jgi:hypothetical protein